MQFFGVAKFH